MTVKNFFHLGIFAIQIFLPSSIYFEDYIGTTVEYTICKCNMNTYTSVYSVLNYLFRN